MGVVLVRLIVVLLNRIGLRFGLGDGLLRPALKNLVDGCCNPFRCEGCVVGWGGVKGIVSFNADGVVSMGMGLERMMGIGGEGVRVSRFLVLGVSRTCAGLAGVS
jgi:hypothetical protein